MEKKKVEHFNNEVTDKANAIKQLKNKISIVERMENLQFYTTPTNDLTFCSFNLTSDNSDESVKSILEVTKTLMLSTLKKQIYKKEKELNDLIKNGLANDEPNDKPLNNCSNCNKERGAF
jgi:hypothetical protein